MEEMVVKSTKEGMKDVMDRLDKVLASYRCQLKENMEFDIAFEELFVNIVHYAYDGDVGDVRVVYNFSEEMPEYILEVWLMDSGIPYNPLSRPDPDITKPASEREVGGLGIFMAKIYLDFLTYERKNGENCLFFKKCFKAAL